MNENILILEPDNFPSSSKILLNDNGFKVLLNDNKSDYTESEVHYIFVRLGFYIDKTFLSSYKNLKAIVSATTGVTHIDSKVRKEIKIIKIEEDDSFINKITPTAEHAVLLSLMAQRNIKHILNNSEKDFRRPDHTKGTLVDKKVLIFGNGRIGKHVDRLISSFTNKRSIFYDILPERSDISYDTMLSLLSSFDIIFLCIKLNKKIVFSKNLIDKVSNQGIIVNISRGEIIDEQSILKKIKANKNFFYCTDVLDQEHNFINNELFINNSAFSNIIITPHIGGYCRESLCYVEEELVKKFLILHKNNNHFNNL
jgi:D-3-phosphoglycerate dehydrogenase